MEHIYTPKKEIQVIWMSFFKLKALIITAEVDNFFPSGHKMSQRVKQNS